MRNSRHSLPRSPSASRVSPGPGPVAIKERVNAITLADAAQYRVDSDLFGKGAGTPEVQARMRALFKGVMQTRGEVDKNFGKALGDLKE